MREYVIPIAGLKNGLNHFNYEIDSRFFGHYSGSLIDICKVFVDLSFDKKERLFILNFDISGTVRTECDRCSLDFDLPLHSNHTLFIKKGVEPEKEDEEEDVMWISENDVNVDMSDWLYEFIHLSVPLRKVHPDLTDGTPGCDPKVISKLKAEQSKPESDPRWDKLKSLDKE